VEIKRTESPPAFPCSQQNIRNWGPWWICPGKTSCPDIHTHIGWTWEEDNLRYWIVPRKILDEEHTIGSNQNKLHNMQTEFDTLKTKFDFSLKDFNRKLMDYHLWLDNNDTQIKTMAKSLHTSLQQVIESSKNSIQSTMEAQKDLLFQCKLTHIMDTNLSDFGSMIRGSCNTHETKTHHRETKFSSTLESIADKIMDKAQKELYSNVEDAVVLHNQQATNATSQLLDTIRGATENSVANAESHVPANTTPNPTGSHWNVDPLYREQLLKLQPTKPTFRDNANKDIPP
jgi:hypothetical protein